MSDHGRRPEAEVQELMRLFESMPEDVDSLVGFLSDENMLIREAAAMKLGRIDGVPDSVFVRALSNDSVKVRAIAALALGLRKARIAVPVLLNHMASDPSRHVRTMCASALSSIGGRAVLDRLLESLDDKNHHIRHVACQAFRRRKNRRAVPRMRSMLSDPDFYVRVCVVETLVSLGIADERLIETAEQLLTDPVLLKNEAGQRESEAEIRDFLDDPEEVRKHAEQFGQTTTEIRQHFKSVLRILRKEDSTSRSRLEWLVERAKQLAAEQTA